MKKMIQFFYRSMILMSIMLFYGHVQGYGQKLVLLDSFIYDQSYLERYGLLHEVLPGIILNPIIMPSAQVGLEFDYIDPSGRGYKSTLQNEISVLINHIDDYVYIEKGLYSNQEYIKSSDSLIVGFDINVGGSAGTALYRYPMIVKYRLIGKNQLQVVDSVMLTSNSAFHEDMNTQWFGSYPWMIASPCISEGGGSSPYYEFYDKNLKKCAVIPSGVPSGSAEDVAIFFIDNKVHIVEKDPVQRHIVSWQELDQISLRVLKKDRFVLDSMLKNSASFSVSNNQLFIQLVRPASTKENKPAQFILAECTQGKSVINYINTQGLYLESIHEKKGRMVTKSLPGSQLTFVENRDFNKPLSLKKGHIALLNERYVITINEQLKSIYLYEIQ